jgi:peptidoglycan/xylan/chitin deacetylase (PgdA/CDA1 family)
VTDDELWRPAADPNAETQQAWPADAAASIPRQGGSRQEAEELAEELAETRFAGSAQVALAAGSRTGAGRRTTRRRVLFAAGGVMLLAGGGVATAAAMEGHPVLDPLGSGAPSGTPTRTAGAGGSHTGTAGTGSPSAAGSTRSTASAHGGSSSPTGSPSGSASGSASGKPSGAASGSPSGSSSGTAVAKQPQWYVDDQGPTAIALTMDDGPHPVYTPQVLEILRKYGIKATFNMIGSQVGANLSLVREVSAEGHTITNHTWNHADLSHLTVSQVLSQMDRCNDALANANQHPMIFRAPYGNWSKAVFEACAERDLKPVGWSVDPRDWDNEHVTTQQIVQNVMKHTHAHDIILEHDGGGDRSHTVAALKIFIPELLDKGFHFVAM